MKKPDMVHDGVGSALIRLLLPMIPGTLSIVLCKGHFAVKELIDTVPGPPPNRVNGEDIEKEREVQNDEPA